MPKITHVEHEKRLRAVQEWIIDDWPSCDIVSHCVMMYEISERQAKRYLADALERWVDVNQQKLNAKRSRRIESLKKLKRSLKEVHKGTPGGIRAMLQIEKELAKLEGDYPTKQMIDAMVAEDAGEILDVLSPQTNTLIIEALMPYEEAPAIDTANS